MTIAPEKNPQTTICQDVIFPPSDIYSNEPPWENDLHLRQIILLLTAQQQAQRLAAKLRELNIDPDTI